MNYYYLVASLPTLSLEAPPPMSGAAFRRLCAEHLTPGDLAALDELDGPLAAAARRPFVAAWRRSEAALRAAAVRARAARLHRDPATELPTGIVGGMEEEKAVSDAFSRNDPLERELALDRFRWRRIEELAGIAPFAGATLLAYALKLRLVERWAAMSAERGAGSLDALVNAPPRAAA